MGNTSLLFSFRQLSFYRFGQPQTAIANHQLHTIRVHHVRDVTQGKDASRIRTPPLVQSWAIARNFALNSYRDRGFENMAQAQRLAGFSLSTLMNLFRMK
jgi:hypothetical protein